MTKRGWLLFAAMGLIWGIPYLMIKVAVDEMAAPVVVFGRCTLGLLVLLPFALRGRGFAAVGRHWRPVLAFAVLEIVVPWLLLTWAEQDLTSSMTGLLIAVTPVIAVVAGRARLTAVRWLGLALGIAGVAVLAAPELRGGSPLAIVAVLVTSSGYATAPLIAARRLTEVPSLALTVTSLAVAAVVYAVPAAVTAPSRWPSAGAMASVVGLGLVCTALAFVVFLALIAEVGPARATVITYVNPAVAVAAGVLVLGEPLTASIVGGFGLILIGSVLATGRRDARSSPQPASLTTPEQADVTV
jgi:drug/metabolite transporter (DMT)-like permease